MKIQEKITEEITAALKNNGKCSKQDLFEIVARHMDEIEKEVNQPKQKAKK